MRQSQVQWPTLIIPSRDKRIIQGLGQSDYVASSKLAKAIDLDLAPKINNKTKL